MSKKVIMEVEFEDQQQDFLRWKIEFDEWYNLGKVIDCQPFQGSVWTQYWVLSGKPKKGQKLKVSLGPDQGSMTMNYKLIKVTELHEANEKTTGKTAVK